MSCSSGLPDPSVLTRKPCPHLVGTSCPLLPTTDKAVPAVRGLLLPKNSRFTSLEAEAWGVVKVVRESSATIVQGKTELLKALEYLSFSLFPLIVSPKRRKQGRDFSLL